MRYVSEQFQALQNETIRPQLQIHFEVNTDSQNTVEVNFPEDLAFDTTVAPAINPPSCVNEHYYAVLGDACGVDDPNRICAPDNTGALSTPQTTVPYGITPYTAADTEALIGSEEDFYNFSDLTTPTTLHFKGLIPEYIRVEAYDYDTDSWVTEQTIVNTEMSENIVYTPLSTELGYIRFYVKNTTTAGRFQLLWIKADKSGEEGATVVFENEYVSNISISMETDLTSQTMPSYEMTVECLDIDEEYSPNTEYWNTVFTDGRPCLLKAGYEIGDSVEYVPIMYGVLTKKPSFSEGKITFNIEFKDGYDWGEIFTSIPSSSASSDQPVVDAKFIDYVEDLFTSYDIFTGQNDENRSLCNYYGRVEGSEAKQLVANALGGYITARIDDFAYDLHSTVKVQYKLYDDYLPRSNQVQCTLENQPKVGKIAISKHEYTLLSEYKDVTSAATRMSQGENQVFFNVPFFAIGRMTAQNFPSGYSIVGLDYQSVNEDGTVLTCVIIKKSTSGSATNTYTIRFYKVADNELKAIEEITNAESGESYENSNILVTNDYIVRKVNSVAHFVGDVADQYEVDYMQDLRYELGDIIRLETQEGVFKSCIITELQYNFPGSTGRLTCRKIFSLLDCPQAVFEPDGLTIKYKNIFEPDWFTSTILETSENGVVVGLMKYNETESVFFVLGATKMTREYNGTEAPEYITNFLTDLNGHKWGFLYYFINSDYFDTNAPILELPDYDAGAGAESAAAFGIINFLSEIYSAQGMTAPVDYTCTVEQIA